MHVTWDPLLQNLLVAGVVWAAIVPVLAFRALQHHALDPRRRFRLALVISGWTLLWLVAVGGIAAIALAHGGRAALAIALMGLMFLAFGAACLPARVRPAPAGLLPWPKRSGARGLDLTLGHQMSDHRDQ